jgi:hypothetical protein
MWVREEHQDNARGTRDVLTSQTVTALLAASRVQSYVRDDQPSSVLKMV